MPAVFPPIPSFSRSLLRLRLHHSARLHFRHEVMWHSLLNEAMGKGCVPDSVVPFACESGRVDFAAEDEYRIGLTIVGMNAAEVRKRLERSLEAYASRGWQGDAIPMLRWFTLIGTDDVAPPDLAAESGRLRDAPEIVLQFVSPLCIEIPQTRPHRYFDSSCFPAGDFLRRVWGRFFSLQHGRPPNRAETAEQCPPLPTIAADPSRLLWIDVPRMQKPPLGGVVGRITMTNPGEEWLPLLVAAQYLHIGKGTGDGFGAFRIVNDAPLWNDPFGPSRTLLERAAEMPRLEKAADEVLSSTTISGTGGPEMLSSRKELLIHLKRGLEQGSHSAAPLRTVVVPYAKTKLRTIAVPSHADRIAQCAALDVLEPAVRALFGDCSLAYQARFAQANDSRTSFAGVDRQLMSARFQALYPFEPLLPLLEAWAMAPVEFEGRFVDRSGLPDGAIISTLLANLSLADFRYDGSATRSPGQPQRTKGRSAVRSGRSEA